MNLEGLIPVDVGRILLDENSQSYAVLLREKNGDRVLPIWIGQNEAYAILFALEGEQPPRPLTHDLLKMILDASPMKSELVVINRLEDSTFFARIVLREASDPPRLVSIDARPSDSIALALRTHTPIMVAREVMEKAGISPEEGS